MTVKQPSFFDDDQPTADMDWDLAAATICRIAEVVFSDGLDGTFDYLIPEKFYDAVDPGMRLQVPRGKGNMPVTCYCVGVRTGGGLTETSHGRRIRLKEIVCPLDSRPLLSAKMIELARWIARQYLCPLGQVLETVLPAGVRGHAGTRLTTVWTLVPDIAAKLAKLDKGNKENQESVLTPKQRYVLDVLAHAEEPMTLSELCRAAKCSMVPVLALRKYGLFAKRSVRRKNSLLDDTGLSVDKESGHELNAEQQSALNAILEAMQKKEFHPFLLHGVTGSGKTEVYIRAIEEAVASGRQAIVLVPEISLTPQTVNRFRRRFRSVAVLHSHLTDTERHGQWLRIESGDVQVVVGARSAVFAPVPRLGLIVIDEEHENSFKQETAPRYHARAVAMQRARVEKVPVILGSATPSLESWQNALKGRIHLLTMANRVMNLPLPDVSIVDLRSRVAQGFTRGAIHQQLGIAIRAALDEGGQIILLLNRRGFSTQIQCPACGEVMKCPECDVTLTHHLTQQIALCHYCDYQVPAPTKCPACGFAGIRYSGFGTQKLEQELAARFPEVTVLRMDTDTMQGHGAHERALAAFREGKFQILLGTQMIAKGLDFPNVTLVGVINADTALYLPDFRAAERTFHLITQVAGRTGRGDRKGEVIVQTYNPDHAAIIAASHHDFLTFARDELRQRHALGYPPFASLVRLVFRGPNEEQTRTGASQIGQAVRESLQDLKKEREQADGRTRVFRILGPAPAPFAKLRGFFRFHVHLHGNDRELLRLAVENVLAKKIKLPNEVQWIVDIDPVDML
ncbi:MAG: primosomal protein N' [Planctomycetia bacterium]|nr:primosomal protein N' [Planctomycetia bacterium]